MHCFGVEEGVSERIIGMPLKESIIFIIDRSYLSYQQSNFPSFLLVNKEQKLRKRVYKFVPSL